MAVNRRDTGALTGHPRADSLADVLERVLDKGIVIAGVGNGNMNKSCVTAAANAVKKGVVVVRSSRVATGLVGRNVELNDDELTQLGLLQGSLSAALREVVGCRKTYSALFAEADGFAHLHVHLVPRLPDQPPERRGPAVFGYLGVEDHLVVPEGERDRIARAIGDLVKLP